jgi:hypothetical protein
MTPGLLISSVPNNARADVYFNSLQWVRLGVPHGRF